MYSEFVTEQRKKQEKTTLATEIIHIIWNL